MPEARPNLKNPLFAGFNVRSAGYHAPMNSQLPALPAPPGSNLPAEYWETPGQFALRKLQRIQGLQSRQRPLLEAVVAGLRVTESAALCEALQRRIARLLDPERSATH